MAKAKKAQLAQQVRDGLDGGGQKALLELIDALISEYHEANESNKGDEFLVTQGKIQGHRDLIIALKRQPKPKK